MDEKKDDVMAEMMNNLNHKSKNSAKDNETSKEFRSPKKSVQSSEINKSHSVPVTSRAKVNKETDNNESQPRIDASMLAYNTQLKLSVIADLVGLQRVYGFSNRSQAVRLLMNKRQSLRDLVNNRSAQKQFKIIKESYLLKTMPAAKRRWKKYHNKYNK